MTADFRGTPGHDFQTRLPPSSPASLWRHPMAPVESALPRFAGTAFEHMSPPDVAEMNSGLDIPTPPLMSWDPKLAERQEWNRPNESGLTGFSEYLLTLEDRKHAPGTQCLYQDPNAELLGLANEAATGQGLAADMQEKA